MCVKCNATGTLKFEAFEGAWMIQPCNCEIAKQKQAKAAKRLEKLRAKLFERVIS